LFCGKWVNISKSSFPTSKYICDFCFEEIGGIKQNPVPRKGNFRIFKNKAQEENYLRNVSG
jgi:hypothetical protein